MGKKCEYGVETQLEVINRAKKALEGEITGFGQNKAITDFLQQYDTFAKLSLTKKGVPFYLIEEYLPFVQERLIKGAENFQEHAGVNPTTYLYWYFLKGVNNAREFMITQGFTGVGIKRRSWHEYTAILHTAKHIYEKTGKQATDEEIKQELSKDNRTISQSLASRKKPLSYIRRTFQTIKTSPIEHIIEEAPRDTPSELTFDSYTPWKERKITSKKSNRVVDIYDIDEDHTKEIDNEEQITLTKKALSLLTKREQIIIAARFGLHTWLPEEQTGISEIKRMKNGTCSLEELGGYFKLTRERIRQVEGKAIKKLRAIMGDLPLEETKQAPENQLFDGEQAKTIRKTKGLTLKQLAEAVMWKNGSAQIFFWETGKNKGNFRIEQSKRYYAWLVTNGYVSPNTIDTPTDRTR
ncbi:hypothetical protein HY486_04370 [Candidatus Woesearchaeota archaeon]|nr:hypothetical protein [Candidatus Woesearchaeota archaeon]